MWQSSGFVTLNQNFANTNRLAHRAQTRFHSFSCTHNRYTADVWSKRNTYTQAHTQDWVKQLFFLVWKKSSAIVWSITYTTEIIECKPLYSTPVGVVTVFGSYGNWFKPIMVVWRANKRKKKKFNRKKNVAIENRHFFAQTNLNRSKIKSGYFSNTFNSQNSNKNSKFKTQNINENNRVKKKKKQNEKTKKKKKSRKKRKKRSSKHIETKNYTGKIKETKCLPSSTKRRIKRSL